VGNKQQQKSKQEYFEKNSKGNELLNPDDFFN